MISIFRTIIQNQSTLYLILVDIDYFKYHSRRLNICTEIINDSNP